MEKFKKFLAEYHIFKGLGWHPLGALLNAYTLTFKKWEVK